MSKEEELLESIFGGAPTWRGYKITWCDLCNVYIIGCKDEKCRGSSCNGCGCDKCVQDHNDFNALHPQPEYYMTEAERDVVEKYDLIKRMLREQLGEGKSFNLAECRAKGMLSPRAEKLFK